MLAADADAEVRIAALDTLNARLRQTVDGQARAVRLRGPSKARGFADVAIADDLLVAAESRAVEAFDPRTGRRRWRSRSIGADVVLILNDRVIVGDTDGALTALDARGTVAWRSPSGGEDDRIQRLLAIDRALGVLRKDRFEWRDPGTGRILQSIAGAHVYDADVSGRTVYLLTGDQLQKIVDGRVLARRDVRRGLGVSARDNMVCVVRSENNTPASAELACFDGDTLAPRWTRSVPRTNTWGHRVAPVQSASSVFMPSAIQLTAFRRDDGAPLWADRAGQEVQGGLFVASWGLFSTAPDYRLELRAPDSGEVIAIGPGKKGVIAVAPSGRVAAFGARDGSLWILRP